MGLDNPQVVVSYCRFSMKKSTRSRQKYLLRSESKSWYPFSKMYLPTIMQQGLMNSDEYNCLKNSYKITTPPKETTSNGNTDCRIYSKTWWALVRVCTGTAHWQGLSQLGAKAAAGNCPEAVYLRNCVGLHLSISIYIVELMQKKPKTKEEVLELALRQSQWRQHSDGYIDAS